MIHDFTTELRSNSSSFVTVITSDGWTIIAPFSDIHRELQELDLKHNIVTIKDNDHDEIIFNRRHEHYISYLDDFINYTTFKFDWEK